MQFEFAKLVNHNYGITTLLGKSAMEIVYNVFWHSCGSSLDCHDGHNYLVNGDSWNVNWHLLHLNCNLLHLKCEL